MLNKNNKKNNFNELFEVAYNKLKKYENKNYEFYFKNDFVNNYFVSYFYLNIFKKLYSKIMFLILNRVIK